MRKIIAYIAISADGFIARPDGNVGWLDRPTTAGDYGIGAFYKSIDTVVMGRRTYDIALKLGQKSYPGKRNYIFSRTRRASRTPDVEFVRGDIKDFARGLRGTKGKNIWLVGGAELIGAFLDACEIDEFVIHVIPVFIGEGIPLINPRHRHAPLSLVDCKSYPDGVVQLQYSVIQQSVAPATGRKVARAKRTRRS